MRNPSRSVVLRPLWTWIPKAVLQELVEFPSIHLPSHLREALIVAAPNQASLPESTPNPSLTYFSDDYLTPNVPPLGSTSNGNGDVSGRNCERMGNICTANSDGILKWLGHDEAGVCLFSEPPVLPGLYIAWTCTDTHFIAQGHPSRQVEVHALCRSCAACTSGDECKRCVSRS